MYEIWFHDRSSWRLLRTAESYDFCERYVEALIAQGIRAFFKDLGDEPRFELYNGVCIYSLSNGTTVTFPSLDN